MGGGIPCSIKEAENCVRIHICAQNANTSTGICGSKGITTAPNAVQRWMVMRMDNRKPIAYAVDADTIHIMWILWERKDNER